MPDVDMFKGSTMETRLFSMPTVLAEKVRNVKLLCIGQQSIDCCTHMQAT
jgi:hypothetical protein